MGPLDEEGDIIATDIGTAEVFGTVFYIRKS